MATINFNTQNSLSDNVSFALLRTNPALSTNVRLVVDSNDDIFLSAFKAGKSLSKVEFQKYQLKETGDYSIDLAKFYGNSANDEKFATLRQHSDITAYGDYAYQYEDQYQYGASFNSTKLYNEQYKIFAPIWLEKKMPSKFVIYRVDAVDYTQSYDESPYGQNQRILELLNKATIIKTFDLSTSTKIGKYLNKYVNNSAFPSSAITFNFEQSQASYFNGIDVLKGGFVSKKEYLEESYTQTDFPEIYSNQIITDGFKRNSVAVANIINLEFLFDDSDATNYEIYRYFGLYVDAIEEGSFEVDSLKGNIITIKKDSVITSYDLTGTSLTPIDMLPNPADLALPTINYVRDKKGDYHHVQNLSKFNLGKLPVCVSHSNNGAFFEGYAKTNNSINDIGNRNAQKGFITLTVNSVPSHNDRIFIGDISEIKAENYDLTYFTIVADSSLQAGYSNNYRFSTQGSLEQIAIALASAIYGGRIISYKTYVNGNKVTIEDYAVGHKRDKTILGININNVSDFLQVDFAKSSNLGLNNSLVPALINTDFTEWDTYTMLGGAADKQCVIIKEEDLGDVQIGQFLKKKDSETYIKISQIVKDPILENAYRIILEKPTQLSNDNVYDVYESYSPKFGKFVAYNFKDFNFDFYDTSFSDVGELNYEMENARDYFKGLTPVLQGDSADDNTVLEKIYSEYDRLKENQLKETALISRVVPTITKFALKNSTNARNLPYILNVNEAFGTDNLSPNIDVSSLRNPEYFSMEYFHFGQIPDSYDTLYINTGLSSYINFNRGDILTSDLLKSTDYNYFETYFKWNGAWSNTLDAWINDKFSKMYTIFEDGNGEMESNTVFRGLRYNYKKRKETSSSNPTEFINTTETNGYKFGIILNYLNEQESNSSRIEVVKNDIFKFICVVITISVIDNDVTEINRNLLYTLENIEKDGVIVNTPVGATFNMFNANWLNGDVVLTASAINIANGTAKFTEQIKPLPSGEYSYILFNTVSGVQSMKVKSVLNDYQLVVDGYPVEWGNGAPVEGNFYTGVISVPELTTEYTYFRGGEGAWTSILENITAKRFSERFNQNEDITYFNISETAEEVNTYVLEIEDGVPFIKPSLIEYATDGDKPKSYQLGSNEVGKVLIDRTDGGYFTVLRRMNGGYNPLFKDVITFSDIYTAARVNKHDDYRQLLIYNKFNDLGISFESYKLASFSYGYINNYFFHKVNDENAKNLLKLSQSTDKPPLYPLIGEVAIDKKNINLLKSKYASDYFTKSFTGLRSETINGTLSPVEKKAFMVSTVMKVSDTYDLTAYTSKNESSLISLDEIRINKLNTASIHWTETDSTLYADFYLSNSIIDELREDGIASSFKKYVQPQYSYGDKTSIEDDLDSYIVSNVVNRFIIDNIDVYAILGKNFGTSSFVSVVSPDNLKDDNFSLLTGHEIKRFENEGLSFRLIYNKRPGYYYQFKVHVKIQA